MNGSDASISWKTHDSVLIVTIDHQRRRNALNPEAHQCLADVFDEFSSDAHIQVAIITGAGDKAFCSGSDLSVEAGLRRESLPRSGFGGLAERFDLTKPIIAAVNGDAIGGGLEIVLACDLCVAALNARFALPEPRVGLAASGGLHRLMRQISEKHAKELALTARMFSAEDAYRFGLVNILCEPGLALTRALSLAQEICKGAPLAVQATKQMMDQGRGITELETAFATTYPAFERMINSLDADEGRRAFLEKRDPQWRAE